MKYTNKFRLPQAYVNAIVNDSYFKGENVDFSITELIDSPRISQLSQRYQGEMSVDVVDFFYTFIGNAVHDKLDVSTPESSIIQRRFTATIEGCIISGKSDNLDLIDVNAYNLNDHKTTSVWSGMLGGGAKTEWVNQLMGYKGLIYLSDPSIKIKSATITAIYRDWKEGDVKYKSGYPESPIEVFNIPLPSEESCVMYLKNRVLLHKAARSIEDSTLLPWCTKEEKWERDGKFAVHQKLSSGDGIQKKAYRLHDTMKDAIKMVEDSNGKMEMVHRPSSRVRCEGWCRVKEFCNQYKEESL